MERRSTTFVDMKLRVGTEPEGPRQTLIRRKSGFKSEQGVGYTARHGEDIFYDCDPCTTRDTTQPSETETTEALPRDEQINSDQCKPPKLHLETPRLHMLTTDLTAKPLFSAMASPRGVRKRIKWFLLQHAPEDVGRTESLINVLRSGKISEEQLFDELRREIRAKVETTTGRSPTADGIVGGMESPQSPDVDPVALILNVDELSFIDHGDIQEEEEDDEEENLGRGGRTNGVEGSNRKTLSSRGNNESSSAGQLITRGTRSDRRLRVRMYVEESKASSFDGYSVDDDPPTATSSSSQEDIVSRDSFRTAFSLDDDDAYVAWASTQAMTFDSLQVRFSDSVLILRTEPSGLPLSPESGSLQPPHVCKESSNVSEVQNFIAPRRRGKKKRRIRRLSLAEKFDLYDWRNDLMPDKFADRHKEHLRERREAAELGLLRNDYNSRNVVKDKNEGFESESAAILDAYGIQDSQMSPQSPGSKSAFTSPVISSKRAPTGRGLGSSSAKLSSTSFGFAIRSAATPSYATSKQRQRHDAEYSQTTVSAEPRSEANFDEDMYESTPIKRSDAITAIVPSLSMGSVKFSPNFMLSSKFAVASSSEAPADSKDPRQSLPVKPERRSWNIFRTPRPTFSISRGTRNLPRVSSKGHTISRSSQEEESDSNSGHTYVVV